MSLRILLILLSFIAITNLFGQQFATPAETDIFIKSKDSTKLKTLFSLRDSVSGFIINEATFIVDEEGNLMMVRHKLGDHPGRVSGHLIRESTYFFRSHSLIKVNRKTFDFARVLHDDDVYLTNLKMKEMKKRVYKHYMKKSKLYIKQYQSYIKTNGAKQ